MTTANFEAALAVASAASAGDAPASTPDTPSAPATDAPVEPTTTEQPAESAPASTPAPTPKLERATLEKIRERQAAKQPQRQQPSSDPEFAEYQAWKAARAVQPQARGIDPTELNRNPIAALEAAGLDPTALLNTLSKHAVTPDVATLEAKVEQRIASVLEENKQLRTMVDQIREERQANAQRRGYSQARTDFISNTSDAAKYPSLAKLGDERRADLGAQKARELMAQGIEDFSLSEVADLVESDVHSLLSEALGRDQAAPQSAEQAPSQSTATTGSAQRRPGTITSSAASSTAATPRRTSEKERVAAALELARRG